MPLTRNDFTSDGTRTLYPVAFPLGILRRGDVYVYTEGNEYTNQLEYTWPADNQIELNAAPANGTVIHIRRVVSRTQPINDYENGAIIEESNLDASFAQTLMIQAELEDGYYTVSGVLDLSNGLNMNNNKITNLAPGTAPTDGISLGQLGDHLTLTEAARDAAESFKTTAETKADEATTAATVAASSLAQAQQAVEDAEDAAEQANSAANTLVSILNYGASEVNTNNLTAFDAMAAALGYVIVPAGTFNVYGTLDYPVFFNIGAAINVPQGESLLIHNRVESPRQHIFKGAGTLSIGHDDDSGEDARQVHISWFGAFPSASTSNNMAVDTAPSINKAMQAMGNGRESLINFDIGNYRLESTVTVTRGCWIKGSGTRNTVFKVVGSGFDAFVTSNVACKFHDIQFETPAPHTDRRTDDCFIRINHDGCEVFNVNVGQTQLGVVVNSTNCKVQNISTVYSSAISDSSVVLIESGATVKIHGVYAGTSAAGVENVVKLGGSRQTGAISNVSISNISYQTLSRAVNIESTNNNIASVNINDIVSNGFTSPAQDYCISMRAPDNVITRITLDNILNNSNTSSGLLLNASGGTLSDISVSNFVSSGNLYGCNLVRTGGSIADIRFGTGVNFDSANVPFNYEGSNITQIKVSPSVLPNTRAAYVYDFTVSDDDVVSVDFNRSIFTCTIIITAGTSTYGMFVGRLANNPTSTQISASTDVRTIATVLNGTTGDDGNLTVGFTNGSLYVENRLGASQRISVSVLSAI